MCGLQQLQHLHVRTATCNLNPNISRNLHFIYIFISLKVDPGADVHLIKSPNTVKSQLLTSEYA